MSSLAFARKRIQGRRVDKVEEMGGEANNGCSDGAGAGRSDDRDRTSNTGTLGKALVVLDLIAYADEPPKFTELLGKVNQPRGTLHRQISNLVAEGLVTVNMDHSYSPGLRLLKLAARAWSQNSIRAVAEPHLRNLHVQTGETVHLGLLNDVEVVYLDKIESTQSVRMHSQVGNASPLYCTGIGKAMLARLPQEICTNLVERFKFVRFTENTLYTQQLLLADIAEIRKTGTSHDREEHEPGIRCVAAGFGGSELGVVAGVSVTAPAFRITVETVLVWEPLVRQTARAIESDFEAKLGPRFQE